MKFFYRGVLFLVTVLFMFISLLLAIYSFGFAREGLLPEMVHTLYSRWDFGLLFILAFIAGAWIIYPLFINEERKNTRISESELGEVDISLDALDNLVQTVAQQQEGVLKIRNRLMAREDGLHIILSGKVKPDFPLPELTSNLQQIVKSYVEDTTGVSVAQVKILIEDIQEKKPVESE